MIGFNYCLTLKLNEELDGQNDREFNINIQNEKINSFGSAEKGRKTTTHATHFIIQVILERFSYCFSKTELKSRKGRLPEFLYFRVHMKIR